MKKSEIKTFQDNSVQQVYVKGTDSNNNVILDSSGALNSSGSDGSDEEDEQPEFNYNNRLPKIKRDASLNTDGSQSLSQASLLLDSNRGSVPSEPQLNKLKPDSLLKVP